MPAGPESGLPIAVDLTPATYAFPATLRLRAHEDLGLTRPVLRFGPSVFPAGWAFYLAVAVTSAGGLQIFGKDARQLRISPLI